MSSESRLLTFSESPREGFTFDEAQVQACIDHLDTLPQYPVAAGELSLVFLTDDELAQMHGDYCDDPTPTDVITFDGDADMDFAGEIYLSVDRALEVAPQHGNSFAQELTLYLVHGWLHLAGLNDIEEADRARMRVAEREVMASLEAAGLVPAFGYAA